MIFDALARGRHLELAIPRGSPATSTLRNPRVVYNNGAGEYDVTLTVTNPEGSSTKTIEKMVRVLEPVVNEMPVSNDFSGGLDNLTVLNPDDGITWLACRHHDLRTRGQHGLFCR